MKKLPTEKVSIETNESVVQIAEEVTMFVFYF